MKDIFSIFRVLSERQNISGRKGEGRKIFYISTSTSLALFIVLFIQMGEIKCGFD